MYYPYISLVSLEEEKKEKKQEQEESISTSVPNETSNRVDLYLAGKYLTSSPSKTIRAIRTPGFLRAKPRAVAAAGRAGSAAPARGDR
ncbi:hypothetical protein EVAR_43973_1 [Eumeta japonica]|uniref:Uncharacterized protein n=1 Tax=Eumeta variegata TaxID=151549 RepID=A0A4C1XXE9_EUMVA|nr:hypothetical protein EVAR_43973_1 [Eumeta japonica]